MGRSTGIAARRSHSFLLAAVVCLLQAHAAGAFLRHVPRSVTMRWNFNEDDQAAVGGAKKATASIPANTPPPTITTAPQRSLVELRADIRSVDDREAMTVYRDAIRECKKQVSDEWSCVLRSWSTNHVLP